MQSRKRTRININSNITPISLTSPEQSDTEKEGEDKKKHAEGRPKDPVWDYFDCIDTKHPGHYAATCKSCNHKYKMGSINKLQIHLTRECKYYWSKYNKSVTNRSYSRLVTDWWL